MALTDFTSEQDNVVCVQQLQPYKRDSDSNQLKGWDFLLFVWRDEQEKVMFIMK